MGQSADVEQKKSDFPRLVGFRDRAVLDFYFRALQIGPASIVAPIDKLSLPFAVLLPVLFSDERLSFTQWAELFL